MTTPPNKPSAPLISPRLKGYLARAKAGLADRTKTQSQHAAAQRVKKAIEGLIARGGQQQEAAALQNPEANPMPLFEKSEKN